MRFYVFSKLFLEDTEPLSHLGPQTGILTFSAPFSQPAQRRPANVYQRLCPT